MHDHLETFGGRKLYLMKFDYNSLELQTMMIFEVRIQVRGRMQIQVPLH